METTIQNLLNIPTKTLMELNPALIQDFIICIKDGVSLQSWCEDVSEEPEAYHYTPDELEHFTILLAK